MLLKKKINIKKAGILGILDPLATGILPIIVGQATKYIIYIENDKKAYEVTSKLGVFSECGDLEFQPRIYIDEKPIIKNLTENVIQETFKSFIGDYLQIPPMHSNIKHKGKPLHSYARKNITINREARKRKIYDLKFNYLNDDILSFSVICSSGTYVRTLIQDISNKWGLHSCLYELHRSQVQPFYNCPIVSLDTIDIERINEYVIPISDMLCNLFKLVCTDDEVNKLHNGLTIDNKHDLPEQTLCRILDKNNNFHGVGIITNNHLFPKRLMKR